MSKIKFSFPEWINPLKMWREIDTVGKVWIAAIVLLFIILAMVDVV